jgi:hypothetical protein
MLDRQGRLEKIFREARSDVLARGDRLQARVEQHR